LPLRFGTQYNASRTHAATYAFYKKQTIVLRI